MKMIRLLSAIALCAGLLTACSKQEGSTPTPQAPEASKPVADLPQPAETPKPAPQETVSSSAAGTAQNMINMAQSLIADGKYSDAADLLKRLSSMELTPEQKKLVEDLTAQVEKAMAGAAASDASKKASDAVGGMLGGNK